MAYARQLNIWNNETSALGGVLGFYTLRFSRLIIDWSIEMSIIQELQERLNTCDINIKYTFN